MKLTRTTLVAAAAVLVVAVALGLGLRGSGTSDTAGVTPLSFFPAEPRGVVYVPDVGKVGAALAALEKTKLAELAALIAGTDDPEKAIRAVVNQLGFDPRSQASMKEAGIDPDRGLAFGQDDAGAQLLAVAVADAGRFSRYAAALAKRLGAVRSAEEPLGATGLVATVHRGAGEPGPIVLAHLLRDGHALLASDAVALDALSRAVSRPTSASLAGSADCARARERLGPADVIALSADAWTLTAARQPRSPKGGAKQNGRFSREARVGPSTRPSAGATDRQALRTKSPGPATLGLRIARENVAVRLLLPRSVELAAVTPAAAPAVDASAPLLPHLAPETFLAMRLGGEPTSLRAVVEALIPRGLSLRLSRAGLDLDRDILANLRAGPVVGVGLLPMPDLSGGLPNAESRVSNFNPFRLVTLSLYARVKDPAVARDVLERFAAQGKRFAMEVSARDDAGEKVYTASYAAGEGMTWGLVGDVLVASGSAESFSAARERLVAGGPGWQPTDLKAGAALARSGASLHLDLPKLAGAVKAIPESAFGVGGFQIKDSLDGWADLLSEVRGATAVFEAEPEGLVLDVEVGLQ